MISVSEVVLSGHRYGVPSPRRKYDKVEQYPRLEASWLLRAGVLRAGAECSLSWRGSLMAETAVRGDVLRIDIAGPAGGGRAAVRLQRLPVGFGGTRSWLTCPRCDRRCEVLFVRAWELQCRRCASLVYLSQSEAPIERAWSKQRKIESRLGPNASRPPGMRQRTYLRLLVGIEACERRRIDAVCRLACAV